MDHDDKAKTPSTNPVQELNQRVERLNASRREKGPSQSLHQPFGMLGRSGIELLAGVFVGTFLGVGVDRWLQTSPWGLIIGFIMGSVAGFWNIRRVLHAASQSSRDLDKK